MSKIIIASLLILGAVALPRVQSRVLGEEAPKHSLAELKGENSPASGFQQMLVKVDGTNDTKQRDKRMNSNNGCVKATVCLDPNSLYNIIQSRGINDDGSDSGSYENSRPDGYYIPRPPGPDDRYVPGPPGPGGENCYVVDLQQCENGRHSLCFSEPLDFQPQIQPYRYPTVETGDDSYSSNQQVYRRPNYSNYRQNNVVHKPTNYGRQPFIQTHTSKFSPQRHDQGDDSSEPMMTGPQVVNSRPTSFLPIQNGHSRECVMWGQSPSRMSGDEYCTCGYAKKKRSPSTKN